ncbi:hypothetical protein, partial [Paucimonas lemoignei]|uniref:hypothetical protein n=1 Tax=Paucimonas lemoignei TaxID=29443 RepID=UPI001A9CDCE7
RHSPGPCLNWYAKSSPKKWISPSATSVNPLLQPPVRAGSLIKKPPSDRWLFAFQLLETNRMNILKSM